MSLRSLQSEFAVAIARHILWLNDNGYEVTLGDAFRSPEECSRLGHEESCHGLRLAVDLNLFKDGIYLTSTQDHERSGARWQADGGDVACWGGMFKDGNHYSYSYQGRK